MTDADEELDVSGYQCPLPVLKAAKRLKSMDPGATLRLIATDPAAPIDVAHFCTEQGHELVNSASIEGRLVFLIRKKAPPGD
ncbi:MAG TPA: sulfurtransferase TusA family protein [Aestuariivirgaceae bacterium]|jgi:tRNA 2-thiouridine synthesizing protein A